MSQPTDELPRERDEEIERIREARHRISERFGHDPYRLVAYYMERQQAHKDQLVSAPEPPRTSKSAA